MYRMLFTCVILLTLCSCAESDSDDSTSSITRRADEPNVIGFADDDDAMNAAIGEARANVGTFIAALESPTPTQGDFAIKAPFTDGVNIEHMWVGELEYGDSYFTGVINNEPVDISNYRLGQRITVAWNEISDWMFVDDGALIGGYSIRLIREQMPPDERAQFDANVPFRIE